MPSIMASVHTKGKTIFVGGGKSDIEKGRDATPDTVYAIASASKAFIATALHILAEEGKLKLDEPVKKYLPDFKLFDPYMTGHLTTRDALGHRSGLPRHDLMWLNLPDISLREIVRRLRYLPPAFEPRARMHYQNHMFALASLLAEEVSGMSWQSFLQQRIFDPLGMTSTYTAAADYRGKGLETESQPYTYKDGKIEITSFNTIDNVGCAGCINSTVRDLDKWARLQLGRGVFEGRRIYSQESADSLHSPQMIIKPGEMMAWSFDEVDFTAYGQGWFIESYRGRKLVHHGGTIDGYKSVVGFMPNDDVAFSVLTNLNQNQTPMALSYYICDLILGLDEIDWSARHLAAVKEASSQAQNAYADVLEKTKSPLPSGRSLQAYCGEYEHPGYGKIEVFESGGKLMCRFIGRELELLHAGYDNYLMSMSRYGTYLPVRFDDNILGEIISLAAKVDDKCDFMVFEKL